MSSGLKKKTAVKEEEEAKPVTKEGLQSHVLKA